MIGSVLRIALLQLARNKGRTALTSLGILIGVAAVIAMVSIGSGATAAVEQDLSGLGQNLLFVTPGQHRGPQSTGARPFSEADAEAIRSQVPGVAGVAPLNQLQVVAAVGEKTWRTGVGGSNQDFLSVLNWKVGEGRFFDEAELLSGAEVCLLGRTPQTELFGARDPLGEKVRLDAFTCTVIGTLQPKGRSTFGQDQDELVVLPLRTYQRRFQGNRDIGTLYISAEAVSRRGVWTPPSAP
jgi:putative ABC transport system permease protein